MEGTICKQFVMSVKKRKNLKPCRGFKSFRSLAFRVQFLKNRIFGSSNPSTRRKIENGSMEIRKKLGAKKAEKSLEISAFLVFSRSDLNRPKGLAGAGVTLAPSLRLARQECDAFLPTLSLCEGFFAMPLPLPNAKKGAPFGAPRVWQGQEDSNPRHPVLETGVLPTELYPFITEVLYHTPFPFASTFFKKNHFM